MNPYPTGEITRYALGLLAARRDNPAHEPGPVHVEMLSPYRREPFFEHVAPLELDHASCYARTGLKPPPAVAEWLSENAAGAWSLYLTRDLRGEIAFELDEDRVLYRIRFPS